MEMRTPQKEIQNSFISFRNVTLRIRDRHVLKGTGWHIERGRNWAVLGPNGSGKSTLVRAIVGKIPVVGGNIDRHGPLAQPDAIGYVSFELHQGMISREQALDEARYFSGQLNSYLRVRHVLVDNEEKSINRNLVTKSVWSIFNMHELLDRPIRKLSTGEMRKVLIFMAVQQSKSLLILDEPFEGLDAKSTDHLRSCLDTLVESGWQLLLVTHRLQNIIPSISHVICLKECRVFGQGHRSQMLAKENLKRLFDWNAMVEAPWQKKPVLIPAKGSGRSPAVIEVKDASVRYGELSVFAHLNWTVRKGENWAVIGSNGSGKTTLLQMISVDHPQAYANEIYLFGRRRGSGESIWEVKNRMGVVSTEFQVNYRKPMNVLQVVLSGFFNSIGLYRRTSIEQRNIAQEWLGHLNLSHLAAKRYDHLSFGERRRILITRALVKSPEILVLDEPCQGLDPMNRQSVLDLIDEICNTTDTQLLYVTHHLAEIPTCITHILDLEKLKSQK